MVAVVGRPCVASSCRISHLGMKPVSGGSPPRDRSVRAVVAVRRGVFDHVSVRALIFVAEISFNARNVADVIIR